MAGRKKASKYVSSSEEESDADTFLPKRQRSTRKAQKPARYGKFGNSDLSGGFTSDDPIDDPFECTEDESIYEPPKKNKKPKCSASTSSSHGLSMEILRSYQNEKNLKSRFETICQAPLQKSQNKSDASSHQIDLPFGMSKYTSVEASTSTCTLDSLNGKMDRILAELSVMKEYFIQYKIESPCNVKGLEFGMPKQEMMSENTFENNAFLESNGLPTHNLEHLDRLELNLKSPEFFLKMVCLET